MGPNITHLYQMNTREAIQILPSLALGFTVVCFSVGLIIVNLHFARYGVYSNELVRSEYVTAGALFIFLVTLTQVSISYGKKEIKYAVSQWQDGKHGLAVLFIFFGILEFLSPLIVSLFFISNIKFEWIIIGVLVISSTMSNILFGQLLEFWRVNKVSSDTGSTETEIKNQFRKFLVALALNFGSITLYAYHAYPHLSPAFGGGKREQVMLLMTEQGKALSKTLSLPVRENTMLIGPLLLLTETDSEIVVILEPSESIKFHALRLQKNILEAMLTIPIKIEK